MQSKYKYLIGNEWRESKDVLEVRNPYNNEVVSATFFATEKDMNDAIQAAVRAYAGNENTTKYVMGLLEPFYAHLFESGLGTISEIFDGDAPHKPRGCISQAWSVAEILRAYFEHVFGFEND